MFFLCLAIRFYSFCPVISEPALNRSEKKWLQWFEVERRDLRSVLKMPKSFLVKNKKARRIEEETQDGTKPARCEEKIVGKKNLHISLQGKIFLVPRST